MRRGVADSEYAIIDLTGSLKRDSPWIVSRVLRHIVFQLLAPYPRWKIIDLTNCTSIDWMGVHPLICAQISLSGPEVCGGLAIVGAKDGVLSALMAENVDKRIPLFETADEAINWLERHGNLNKFTEPPIRWLGKG